MTARRRGCLVAGDANMDLLLEGAQALEPGTEQLARGMHLVLGGSSSITAANLAALGVPTSFAGIIGQDTLGTMVNKALRETGVNTRHLLRRNGISTGLTVWHSGKSGRSGITYPGSIARLAADDIVDQALASVRHFHLGGYFLLTGLHRGAENLFRRAKAAGCTTSLDCNYDPSAKWDSGLRNVLPFVDVFLPNESEACAISRKQDVEAAARWLGSKTKCVVIKRGARGALSYDGSGLQRVSAQRVKTLDTTGAGDSFNAGFIARYIDGLPLMDCVRFAISCAAKSTLQFGGTGAFRQKP